MKSRTTGSFILPDTGRVSDRIKSYGRGRICEVCGCNTVLSTYNPAHFCSSHEHVGSPGSRR